MYVMTTTFPFVSAMRNGLPCWSVSMKSGAAHGWAKTVPFNGEGGAAWSGAAAGKIKDAIKARFLSAFIGLSL